MKVHVNVRLDGSADAMKALTFVVGPADTVASLKDRVAIAYPLPFPDQNIVHLDADAKATTLSDNQVLADCGVEDQSLLDLVVTASEAAFVKQLSDLLQARDLSCDELSLMYCYKFGASTTTALKTLQFEGKLQDFVKDHKDFQVNGGHVALMREETKLKPFSVATEVEQMLRATGTGSMTIKELCINFKQKFGTSLNTVAGSKPADFFAKEYELFAVSGGVVHLRAMQKHTSPPHSPADNQYMEVPCGLSELPPGLECRRSSPCPIEQADDENFEDPEPSDSQQHMDLHNSISGRAFNSKVAQALADAEAAFVASPFLNIDHVVRGGAVGKGTAISGGLADASLVLYIRGLSADNHDKWLPPLQRAVAGVLVEKFGDDKKATVDDMGISDDGAVRFKWKSILLMSVYLSPIFASHTEAVLTLGPQGGSRASHTPGLCAAAISKERSQFVVRQPGQVKVTIRLLKWWRDQQTWSGLLFRPSDEILELLAIYSGTQTKPRGQRTAIANVMSLFSRFNELRIVWSNHYARGDVWAPLLRQRPLLMDPVNPYVNVADPQLFDARELMAAARTTHFFW